MQTQNITKDAYQRITDTIVAAIEAGAGKYEMPWRTVAGCATSPINVNSRKAYRGVNTLMLWGEAADKGYQSGIWGTYNQWRDRGAQVRKGEKSSPVVFWKFFDRADESDDDGQDTPNRRRGIPMARLYHVFAAEQVEGFEIPQTETLELTWQKVERAEQWARAMSSDLRHGGNRAYYQPANDFIQMPTREQFGAAEGYYGVLAHEHTHWTGHANRLDRADGMKSRFGSEAYAMEELVAELGAAYVSAELGLPGDPRTENAPYVASWLKALKNDKRAIFTAAAKAQQAADWMMARAEQAAEMAEMAGLVEVAA